MFSGFVEKSGYCGLLGFYFLSKNNTFGKLKSLSMFLKTTIPLIFTCLIIASCGSKKNDPTPTNPPPPQPSKDVLSNFNIPSKHIGDANFSIPLPTTASQGTFTFTSDNPAVATIKGDSIVIKSVGTANITAIQASSGTYTSGSIVASFSVLANIYIAGYAYNPNGYIDLYWKNGVAITMQGTGITRSVLLNNKDIYITGSIRNKTNTNTSPGYWKNGVPVTLSDKLGTAAGMVIYNNDIYVAGYIQAKENSNSIACLWKNGTLIPLQNTGKCCTPNTWSQATGIAVKNGHVYVCGITTLVNNSPAATVWSGDDGSAVTLTTPYVNNTLDTISSALSIKCIGNDLYITGNIITVNGGFLTYWKNSIPFSQTTPAPGGSGSFYAAYNAITMLGSDLYIAGTDSNPYMNAVYWKNGIETILTPTAEALDIAISGNDIYIIGNTYDKDLTTATPVYWLNGNITTLPSTSNTRTTGIAIESN